MPSEGNAPRTVRVWDPLVRVGHWMLVAGVASAWLLEDARVWHERIGYAVAAVIVVRMMWGLAGPASARFATFVRGPARTLAYARDELRHRAPRYLGHNPLGAWMIVALLVTLAGIAATGWGMTTDAGFGSELLEELHEALAHGLLVLVGLHVGGVIYTSWRQRENLVRAMFTGRKRAPGANDVT